MRTRRPERTFEILLVEDNPGDIRLTKEALKEGTVRHKLLVACDGEEALTMLRGADRCRPDLILLDLNLPRVDGREVLAEIKSDTELRRIPVVVLSTSTSNEDVICSYDLHANCYLSKPVDMNQFIEVVRSIEGFWLNVARLPSDSPERIDGFGEEDPAA